MKKSGSQTEKPPSQMIDERIRDDWRGKALSRLRSLIKQADPDVVAPRDITCTELNEIRFSH